jgi:Holliday junction resolvase RusA-like endonuclease
MNSTKSLKHVQVIFGLPPSKSNQYWILKGKDGKPFLGKSPAVDKYESDFYIQCNKYRKANIDGYFELAMDVYYPNQRSDLDGCLKVIMDCLQKCGAIKNDNKCVRLEINKFLDKSNPRIEFTLTPIQ